MIDNHTWDMILGKSGRLPGALAPEIIALAKEKDTNLRTKTHRRTIRISWTSIARK